MIQKLKDIFDNYLKSFNSKDEGYSRKKILGTLFSWVTIAIEIMYIIFSTERTYMMEIIIFNGSLITAFLTIKAVESYKSKKIDNTNNNQSNI